MREWVFVCVRSKVHGFPKRFMLQMIYGLRESYRCIWSVYTGRRAEMWNNRVRIYFGVCLGGKRKVDHILRNNTNNNSSSLQSMGTWEQKRLGFFMLEGCGCSSGLLRYFGAQANDHPHHSNTQMETWHSLLTFPGPKSVWISALIGSFWRVLGNTVSFRSQKI